VLFSYLSSRASDFGLFQGHYLSVHNKTAIFPKMGKSFYEEKNANRRRRREGLKEEKDFCSKTSVKRLARQTHYSEKGDVRKGTRKNVSVGGSLKRMKGTGLTEGSSEGPWDKEVALLSKRY